MEKIYALLFTPLIVLLISCSMDSFEGDFEKEGQHQYNFKESKKQWKELKKRNGNSYSYTVLESSFTGAGSQTTIKVQKGKVTQRSYQAYTVSESDGSKEVTNSYEERSKKEIGKHQLGAPPLTMDQLYNNCNSQFLKADTKANTVHFETNEQGVLMLCGFMPIGCQDDCFTGIRLSGFTWD